MGGARSASLFQPFDNFIHDQVDKLRWDIYGLSGIGRLSSRGRDNILRLA